VFGIGPSELLVILVIALLVLGPKRLPELARSLGKAMGEFRRATADISTELDNARIMLEEESRAAARGQRDGKKQQPADGEKTAQPTTANDTEKSA
jgi:sec-independent protein translocase protein TatB